MPLLQIVKVISVTGEESKAIAHTYEASFAVDQLLLDSKIGKQRGGTGVVHDWNVSKRIILNGKKPVWLAGGIKLHNLKEAITSVKPYGIDVETGVQNSDGSKNYDTIKQFITLIHALVC
jgi:phosphoribosylanthranilate isomerase